jgi:beta-barrel assembly-enhancing protease
MNVKRLLLLVSMFMAFATHAEDGTLSGKPYTPAPNLELNLPELGDISETVLSAQDEKRIGEQILRDVATSDDVLSDAEITDYLQSLGNKLAAAGPDKQQKFTFFVVQDNSINAFAMPGGVIGVHTGLFLAVNSESELASVLGHEIGHVTQHHLARMLAAQKYDTFKNIAGIALALLVARSNPQLANGVMITAGAAGVQRQLDYTREHEREADRVGLTILEQAGFDVRAMPAFFSTLQRNTRFVEGTAPSFLRTHPLTSERISDVSNRVQNLPYRQAVDSLDFLMMRAKIRAMQGLAQGQVEQFSQAISAKRYQNEFAEHYGLAHALLRKNDTTAAMQEINWLKANGKPNPAVAVLEAQILRAQNLYQKALEVYAKSGHQFPQYRALVFDYADLLMATNQSTQAIDLIKNKLNIFTADATLYNKLAKAYSYQGKELLKYQAQAEAYYRSYDLNRAVEQMEMASKATDGNFYEKSIVDSRLKELMRLQAIEKEARKNA